MAESLLNPRDSVELETYVILGAIDFGTTYSGYAFSFQASQNEIKMNKNWGAEAGCESYKTPTCLMTNPDGSFESFGYAAEQNYSDLNPDEDEIGGPSGYNLYRNFKMLLHHKVTKCLINESFILSSYLRDYFICLSSYLALFYK